MNSLDSCTFCSAGVWSELQQGSRITLGSRMRAKYRLKLADAVLQPSKRPSDVLNFQIKAPAVSCALAEIN